MKNSLCFALCLLLISCGGGSPQTEFGNGSVAFKVKITSTWSAQTHPDNFPGSPHFSNLVGAIHNINTTYWEPGKTATPGIEAMAETGATSALSSEIQNNIDTGDTRTEIVSGGFGSPDSITITINVDSSFTFLTLVTMLAPSPDWFIGIQNYNLMPAGNWIDNDTITLYAYDAGTDSGTGYTSANSDTQPKQSIAKITTSPFSVSGSVVEVGEMTITRIR